MVAHLHFLPFHKPTLKNAKELPSQRTTTDKMNGQTATEKEQRRHNSGFAKKRVQWLIEHSTSYQHLWFIDSLVLRNRFFAKPQNVI